MKNETPGMYLRRKLGAQQGDATSVLNMLVESGHLKMKHVKKAAKALLKRTDQIKKEYRRGQQR
jgi:hypothetical protein